MKIFFIKTANFHTFVETIPESELGESEHNRPAPEQNSPQYLPQGPDHEEAGITRISKKSKRNKLPSTAELQWLEH